MRLRWDFSAGVAIVSQQLSSTRAAHIVIELTRSILPSFVIAMLVTWALRKAGSAFAARKTRWLRRLIENLSACVAISVATVFGVLRLQDSVGVPSKFWHWAGPVSVICLLVQALRLLRKTAAPISVWTGASWTCCALLSAWLLVPGWSSLNPGWHWFVIGLTVYLAALALLHEFAVLSAITRGASFEVSRQTTLVGIVTALVLAGAIAANASLKYAELTVVIGVSSLGVVLMYGRQSVRDISFATLVPCIAFMLGVAAFIGMIYPQPPIYRLLALPFAPLSIPFSLRFAKTESRRDVSIRYGVAALVLVVFAALALV